MLHACCCAHLGGTLSGVNSTGVCSDTASKSFKRDADFAQLYEQLLIATVSSDGLVSENHSIVFSSRVLTNSLVLKRFTTAFKLRSARG